jgi:hypothetical protein
MITIDAIRDTTDDLVFIDLVEARMPLVHEARDRYDAS